MVSWDELIAPQAAEHGWAEAWTEPDGAAELSSLLDGVDIGLALWSEAGVLLHCNRMFRLAFGFGNQACRPGASLRQILVLAGAGGNGVEQAPAWIERLLEAHRAGSTAEWRGSAGQWWQIHFAIRPNRQRLCRVLDISHQKRLEQECRQLAASSERETPLAKGLAHMGHELRTPLNAIIGFSDLIRSEAIGRLGHPSYAEYAQDIHDSGQVLLTAVDRIALMVKLEAGLVRPQSVEVSHRVLIALALETVEPIARAANVSVLDRSGEADISLFVDRFLASSILIYLLENAIAATEAKGVVEVHCAVAADDSIALEVRDRGKGIDPSVLGMIREPFVRLDSVNPQCPAGVGMGLAVADRMADALNCIIELESTPAHGTTARLAIPVDRVVHAAPSLSWP